MKNKLKTPESPSEQARYLLEDFLEMKTSLSTVERKTLMHKIESESGWSENLKSQPAVWMENRILLVLREQPAECWFYYVKTGKMEKIQVRESDSTLRQSVATVL